MLEREVDKTDNYGENNNNQKEAIIKINSTKENVYEYFMKKSDGVNKKKIDMILNDEIDGEALIILINHHFFSYLSKIYGIKPKIQNEISKEIETDIFRINYNIKPDSIYEEISNIDFDELCNTFHNKLEKLKFGQILKYIKYIIMKNPPNKENKNELKQYLQKILLSKVCLDDIVEDFDELLNLNDNDFKNKCSDYELEEYDIFFLILIIEFIKIKKVNDDNLKIEKNKENNTENIGAAPNYSEENTNTLVDSEYNDSKYSFYCVVEVYEYETSQGDIVYGMKNPIEEFKRLCEDFHVTYEKECEKIEYKEADKTELSSFMIWGSKEGISFFLEKKKIKQSFDEFMNNNNYDNKAGIYFCVDIIKNIGYLIIWTGKFTYQYSKISDTNNNMLLTLIRYGFYLSPNSILCLSKNEINELNINGYKICQDKSIVLCDSETNQIDIDYEEKYFKIKEKKNLALGIDSFNQKKIIESKSRISHNILLVFEESKNVNHEEIKTKDCNEFWLNESKLTLFFDQDFEIDQPEIFYSLIKVNPYFQKNNHDKICYTHKQLIEIFEKKLDVIIEDIFKQLKDELLDEKNYKCIYCNKTQKETLLDLYFKTDDNNSIKFFHEKCFKDNNNNVNFNYFLFTENEKYKLYETFRDITLNKDYVINKEFIKEFFTNFEENNSLTSGNKNIIDYQNFLKEIEKLRMKLLNNEDIKVKLIEEEMKQYETIKADENCIKSWIENWKQKINNHFYENKDKINKWIILKKYDNIRSKLKYILKEINIVQSKLNLFEFMLYRDSNDLKLVNKDLLGNKLNQEIVNYFPFKDKGLIIYKLEKKYKIFLNERDSIIFEGLYDFDIITQTLIIYKKEGNNKKFGIYINKNKNNSNNKNINLKFFKDLNIKDVNENSIIHKIKLIPCLDENNNQNALFYINNEIKLIKIKDPTDDVKTINLKTHFEFNKFDEFQFVVSMDFIMILKFDDNQKVWKGKLFSLIFEDNTCFNEIENIKIELNAERNSKFSFSEIKDKKYLFALSFEDEKPKIYYWEIISQLSGIVISSTTTGENENQIEEKIPLGNCILNYFYHCFDKYPLLGAIEYNFIEYEGKKQLNLSFFTDDDYAYKIPELSHYINELKKLCESKKNCYFADTIDFRINNYNNNSNVKDISLGKLLIKFLEIVPIQIAKIMGYEFKIMSNGEKIDNLLLREQERRRNLGLEKKLKVSEYSKLIHFSLKESIFNYFKLPVVVICCFGTQSIGKSTFLNELTGALFDVSGMRCTEGIWMTIKLFMHSLKFDRNKCDKKCKICKIGKCKLIIIHNSTECICENCMCGKECQLKGEGGHPNCCDVKCHFKKGHEELLKCLYENCECKCKCSCICKNKNFHKHICYKCKSQNMLECVCLCKCKHFCQYPILMHNFICICLDFEGIGTFERTNEQDIQMALIGAAMGNAVIFRIGNSYDKFTEETMEKLSLGSNTIQSKNESSSDFFGGTLFFCPRDINESHRAGLYKEFKGKIEQSIKKWLIELKGEKKNIKYNTFGLFFNYSFSPTPVFTKETFYEYLRIKLIDEIVGYTFKFGRHPIYETGIKFCSNFKTFLSLIFMNDYEFLPNLREEEIRNYYKENLNKAFEVMGEYEYEEEINDIDYLTKVNNLNIFYNKNFLKKLLIEFNFENKFETNETLLVDKISISKTENVEGIFNIEKYGIILNVKKTQNNYFCFSIDKLNDFGLILSIPKTITKINSTILCSDLFKLWDDICKKIDLTEKEILDNFELFISALIQRRNQNVYKWIEEITTNYNNLKDLHNPYSPLIENWRICNNTCTFCLLKCNKLLGHIDRHECPYDHKCKEMCSICAVVKCNGDNCQGQCKEKTGHIDRHSCSHFHKCLNNCEFYDNCKKKCNLEYNNHNGNHRCELTVHKCKEKCHLSEEAKNCGGQCDLLYPHPGRNCNCNQQHYCKKECSLKGKKGCKQNCTKLYHEDEEHNCGENHFCVDDCFYKDKANNCGKKCNLPYPHPGRNCNCNKQHYCKKECSLKGKSKENTCNKICSKFYHEDNHHICHIAENEHICNKTCQYGSCNKKCNLPANHTSNINSKCLCGECTCTELCKYNDKSRNCEKRCSRTGGHEGDHKCQQSEHYCKEICKYNNYCSSGCDNNCKYIFKEKQQNNEHEHMCKNPLSDHKCNKQCDLHRVSGCINFCNSSIDRDGNHNGIHICKATEHCCIINCQFKEISPNCKERCNIKISNNKTREEYIRFKNHTNHICSIPETEHKCQHQCKYFMQSGVRCDGICDKQVNHSDPCKCSKVHKCQIKCRYFNDFNEGKCEGCLEYCSSDLDHTTPEHLCNGIHKCKGLCYKKDARGCNLYCKYNHPHSQNHECFANQNQHLCNKKCPLYLLSRDCGINCKREYLHSGDCICQTVIHHCKKNCSYPGCGKKCCLPPGHPDNQKCVCTETQLYHICNKKCPLKNVSGGCRWTCRLDFRHQGECRCFLNENDPHTCLKECELKEQEKDGNSNTLCGHVYNHENKQLYCSKCLGSCKMFNKGHLCGRIHKCKGECNLKGYCNIEPSVGEPTLYESNHQQIEYENIFIKEPNHLNCIIEIPPNEFYHPNQNNHKCRNNPQIHKCGYKCKQCNNYCKDNIFHTGLHYCSHANIVNSKFIIKGTFAEIKISDNKTIMVKNTEEAKFLFCHTYCENQGQGHTHLVHKSEIKNIEDPNVQHYEENYYECKCSYFWESVLEFEYPYPSKSGIFNLCDSICPCDKDTPERHNYCSRELWHAKDIPHKFNCDHPVYTIFLIDRSGSMGSSLIKPKDEEIKKKHNNMLGATIEALLIYCEKRNLINGREKCALIGYDYEATVIFKDYNVNDEYNIKNKCLSELEANGGTVFENAFKKAKEILEEINDKKEYIPVIILLTDGIDFYPEKTNNYIKDKVSLFI